MIRKNQMYDLDNPPGQFVNRDVGRGLYLRDIIKAAQERSSEDEASLDRESKYHRLVGALEKYLYESTSDNVSGS